MYLMNNKATWNNTNKNKTKEKQTQRNYIISICNLPPPQLNRK